MASVIAKFNAETVINWFPGHMNKTVAKIRDTLKRVDTVIEVRDARVRAIDFAIVLLK
jgi:ribosome biogenesis GTPase A